MPYHLRCFQKEHKMELKLKFRDSNSLLPIVEGKQLVEQRYIYPRNWQNYLEGGYYGTPKKIDTLYLYNGRCEWVRVKVVGEPTVYTLVNDRNEVIKYVQDGKEYEKRLISYPIAFVEGAVGGQWYAEKPKTEEMLRPDWAFKPEQGTLNL